MGVAFKPQYFFAIGEYSPFFIKQSELHDTVTRESLVAQITNHKGSGLRPGINIRTRKKN
jgi:hypothetical protein